MTIQIATGQALRGAAALGALVAAVVAADEHDETDWIEWKGPLDLATKEGCFHVARSVLGLANRDPERAQLAVEGVGYVVAGAEPGTLHGLASIDPARFGQVIAPYLGGADGPAWTPSYIPVGNKTVLVVTVEPPKTGDPMWILRREFEKYREGAVFVRKHGRTELADAADMDALQRRLIASTSRVAANLAVSVSGDVPLSWFDAGAMAMQIEEWARAQQAQLVGAARELERSKQAAAAANEAEASGSGPVFAGRLLPPGLVESIGRLAAMADSVSAFGSFEEDKRSLADFEQEVADWKTQVVADAPGALMERYVHAGHGVIRLEIANLGPRFLPDLELAIAFDSEVAKGVDEKPDMRELPAKPRAFGEARPRTDYPYLFQPRTFLPTIPGLESVGRRTWVEDGSIVVRWDVGDLRPHGRRRSDEVYLFLAARPRDGLLHGEWRATARNVDGLLTGTVDVPVAEAPVPVLSLLELATKRS